MKKILALIVIAALFNTGCSVFRSNTKDTGRKNWHDMTQDEIRSLPLQEVIDHLRYDYGTFECPQKSDRMHIPEDVWQKIPWTEEEKYINAALPHKLWNMRHDDNEWPSCHKFRGEDAFGPLAGEGHDKYLPPLPQLVKGRGIARWMSSGDKKLIEIPLFKDYDVTWTPENIPATIEIVDRKCGSVTYGSTTTITKQELFAEYAPSPLQKFSDKSWLETYPYHVSYHIMFKKNEPYCGGKPEGPDKVYFWRYGWRWDSLDNYYNKGGAYVGGHWN